MHPAEVEQVLETMKVCVDTREQPTKRAEMRYKQFGCPYQRKKLNVGDYTAVFTMPDGKELSLENLISIERKESITELCMCFCQERKRFIREFDRARDSGTKVYLLIENASFKNMYAGKYRSHMAPKSLIASILSWLARYDCQIVFVEPEGSGRLIRDILFYEARELLLQMEEGDKNEH